MIFGRHGHSKRTSCMVKFYNEIEDLIIYKEVFSKLLVCFFNAMLDVTMFVSSYRSVPGRVYCIILLFIFYEISYEK